MLASIQRIELGGTVIQIDAILDTPLDAAQRAELTSLAPTALQDLGPLVPLAIPLGSATGTALTIIVPAGDPPQAPGSPDVVVDVHLLLLNPMAGF